MIRENPVIEFMSVEAWIDSAWTPLTADVQTLSIQRGGKRNGPVSTVETGTLHCTLVNRVDLIDAEDLKPNQAIRVMQVIPAVTEDRDPVSTYSYGFEDFDIVNYGAHNAYTQGWETTQDSWTPIAGSSLIRTSGAGIPRTGTFVLNLSRSSGTADLGATRTTSGFVIGRSYVFTVWAKTVSTGTKTAYVGVTGIGNSTPVAVNNSTYVQLSYTFTATSTSHQLSIGGAYATSGAYNIYLDDADVTSAPYSTGSNNGLSGWAAGASSQAFCETTGSARTGTDVMTVGRSTASTGQAQAKRTFTGLTIGAPYTVTGYWFSAFGSDVGDFKIGVTGEGYGAPVTGSDVTWTQGSYTFTATATSHEVLLEHTVSGAPAADFMTFGMWDDISVTRGAFAETVTPAVNTPIYTGRVNDIDTKTILNKSTGRETDHINIVAVDAVGPISTTTRYGAVSAGGVGYETWAARIIRLSDSAPASVSVSTPADDSPIVRYVL